MNNLFNWANRVWISFVYNILGIRHVYLYIDNKLAQISYHNELNKDYIREHQVFMQEQREQSRAQEIRNIEGHDLYKRGIIALEKFHNK